MLRCLRLFGRWNEFVSWFLPGVFDFYVKVPLCLRRILLFLCGLVENVFCEI